jgi:TonB-linked SusC/RagA family outer membrane protein
MKKFLKKLSLIVVLFNFSTGIVLSQQITVKGKVNDLSGNPLPGATVQVKGSTTGTITDYDGNFVLSADTGNELIISYIGFINKEIKVETGKMMVITLIEDAKTLDEVIVVGYGTQRKVNLTGAVGVVDTDAIKSRPVQNAFQALQGISAGLNINYTNGGLLNTRPDINIRGLATIGEGSTGSALILIDGMEGDLNSINPQDIESVSILKDAAASSIYGSRAPFGVILVTTKQPQKKESVTINYNSNFRYATPVNLPQMMDSYTFATYMNDANNNAGWGNVFTEERMQRIWDYQHGVITESTIKEPNSNKWGDGYDYGNDNIDYYQVYYSKWAPSQEHNVSFSGGTGKTTYYISSNYLNQKGFIAYGEDIYNRFTTSAKTNTELRDWLFLNINIKYIEESYTQPRRLNNQLFEDMARQIWPTKPLYDPNGNLYDDHALGLRDGGTLDTKNNWLYQQAQLIIKPIKNWRIILESNYRKNDYHRKQYVNTYYQLDINGNSANAWDLDTSVSEYYSFNNYLSNNFYTDYEFNIDNVHRFKLLAGFQNELNNYKDLGAGRYGLLKTEFPSINTTTGLSRSGEEVPPTVSGMYSQWATAGFFGRINYDYLSKYLLEINLRYDGSSRFSQTKQWGMFPSASLGWNIAEESFFTNLKKSINYLKVRGSYGMLGNQNTSSIYPTYSAMGIGIASGNYLINSKKPNVSWAPNMISASLSWEKIISHNYGVDYGLFDNRLSGSFDYYIRYTNDMVGPSVELPVVLGTTVPLANNTDLKTWGFEFEIGWRDRLKNGLGYGAKFTLSDSQSKILRYSNPTNSLSKYREGQMLGEIWGYTTIGIAKSQEEMNEYLASLPEGGQDALGTNWSAGDIMYLDVNGDGKIDWGESTSDDPGDLSVIGNNLPRYSFGVNLSLDYKGFDFSTFFQGVMKRDVFQNGYYFWGMEGWRGKWFSAGFTDHKDYFRDDPNHYLGLNLDSYFARPLFGTTKNQQVQTRYLQNASYIRLKNIQVGYTLPSTSFLKNSKIRIYISGENLLTLTDMIKIFDPETVSGGPWSLGSVYPLSKVYSFGLNVTL